MSSSKLTIGVAIPCYHGHIINLEYLLKSIENQTRKPDMVVVSCSGVNETDISYKQEMYSFPFKIITNINKLSSAQNRNIASSNLNTDIISFIDADDKMHPQRLEIIEKAFSENDIVLFVHKFIYGFEHNDTNYDISNIHFDIGKLGYYPCGAIKHNEILNHDIANGHCTIHCNVMNTIKFKETSDFYGKEDTIFNTDIIKAFPFKNAYCPFILSNYVPSRTNSFVT
jgi:glycosyltransferase involved in cell wall biosynthesis